MSAAAQKRFEKWLAQKEKRLAESEGERIWDEALKEYWVGTFGAEVSAAIFGLGPIVVRRIDAALAARDERCRIERESEHG